MADPSETSIRLPGVAIARQTPITAAWANTIGDALRTLSRRPAPPNDPPHRMSVDPPFWPKFWAERDGEDIVYKTSVTAGVVIDHAVDTSNAILVLTCPNQYDADGYPAAFDIVSGQSVYVRIELAASGAIAPPSSGDPCYIVIDETGLSSLTNEPPIESDAGAAGYLLYPLADFAVDGDGLPEITYHYAGSHIIHNRKPQFQATGYTSGVARLFTEYDLTAGLYKYKGIKGTGPIEVTEAGGVGSEVIEIGMSDEYGVTGSLWVATGATSSVQILAYENGLITSPAGDWLLTISAPVTYSEKT